MNHPVCIIDDDDDVREVMSFALEYEGIQSIPFASAMQAEAYLSNLTPDYLPSLIFVDFMMPEMDGMEFITLMREKYPDTLGRIPMVLSTARLAEDTDVMPAGVVKLEKPIDLDHFIRIAKEHYLPLVKHASVS
jgi:CheY-like chemotaxis protein